MDKVAGGANYFTIYKITNLVNNKIYIGMHKTKNLNDNYMGSGKVIRTAIRKYGLKNFNKEILFVFDNEQEMRDKEKELVTEDFLNRSDTYNLTLGGKGGFYYVNKTGKNLYDRSNVIFGEKSHKRSLEKYYLDPKTCPSCNKILPYEKRIYTFCSHSCAAKSSNKLRNYKPSKEIKSKIRKTLYETLEKKGVHIGGYFCPICKKRKRNSGICRNCKNQLYKKESEEIKQEYLKGVKMKDLARKYNVSVPSISMRISKLS